MNFNQLGQAASEILYWLPYNDIIRFCLTSKVFLPVLANDYFTQQYLLINYDIKQPCKALGWQETMKVAYEVLKGMKQKRIVVSKSLFKELIQHATADDLRTFNTSLSHIGEPGFLRVEYKGRYIQPQSIFDRVNTPGDTQYADQYDREVNEFDPTGMDDYEIKAKLFRLVDKYMTMPMEYIANINTIHTIPYHWDFWPYMYNDKFAKQLEHIQKRYKHSDIFYYRYFG